MLTRCQYSQRSRRLPNTMPGWSATTLTQCQRIQQLRGHCVSVVKDYADSVQRSQQLQEHVSA